MDELKITLNGQDFTIRPFTLGALRKLEILAVGGVVATGTDYAAQIVSAALADDYPDYDLEKQFRGKVTDLPPVARQILVLSGLLPETAPVGEEQAAAAP